MTSKDFSTSALSCLIYYLLPRNLNMNVDKLSRFLWIKSSLKKGQLINTLFESYLLLCFFALPNLLEFKKNQNVNRMRSLKMTFEKIIAEVAAILKYANCFVRWR